MKNAMTGDIETTMNTTNGGRFMKYTLTIAAALLALSGSALAQDYPNKPVTLVIPYAPGGSTDPLGRFMGNQLQELWGQTVVVENRPGAGGTIGAAHVSQTAPDGYTIMFTTSSYTTAPAVNKDLPYDPVTDLTAVAMPGFSPYLMVAGSNVQSDTLTEFLDEAREREMFLATAGVGSSTHFAGELFMVASGIAMAPVHYGGGGEAMLDLMGGRSDIYVGSMTAVINNVRNGQVKPIALFAAERNPALPDVETTHEHGLEGGEAGLWFGVFTSPGVPKEIVDKLNADILTVMGSEEGLAYLAQLETEPATLTPEEFAEVVRTEVEQWTALAEERGIVAQ